MCQRNLRTIFFIGSAVVLFAVPLFSVAENPALPIPAADAQTKATKIIQEVYGTDLRDAAGPARGELSRKLITHAVATTDDPAAQYVLLSTARDLATDAGDAPDALDAADALAQRFTIAAPNDQRVAVLWQSSHNAATVETCEADARKGIEVADLAIAQDDYTLAAKYLPAMRSAAARSANPALVAAVHAEEKSLVALAQAYPNFAAANARLDQNAADPTANLDAGKFLCFLKGDWDRGLPMLVKGSDESLQHTTALELAHPSDAATQLQLADQWWDLGQAYPDIAQNNLRAHAVAWYEQAEPNLNGISLDKVRVRLTAWRETQITPPQARAVDLLALISIERDTAMGAWKLDGKTLLSDGPQRAAIRIPYQPPEEYDFLAVFTPRGPPGCTAQICSAGGHSFCWEMGAIGNTVDGLESINGHDVADSAAAVRTARSLERDQEYVSLVQVRKDGIKAFINDKLICQYPTNFADVTNRFFALGDDHGLGLASLDGTVAFKRVQLFEITGHGKVLPDAASHHPVSTTATAAGSGAAATTSHPAPAPDFKPHVVNLLALVDTDKDAILGDWKLNKGALVSDNTPKARLALPYHPPEEYDLRVDFTREQKDGPVAILLSKGSTAFDWSMGVVGQKCRLEAVNGHSTVNNPAIVRYVIEPNKKYSCIIQVRNDRVTALMNGRIVEDYKTDYHDLSRYSAWKLPDDSLLGLGTWTNPVAFQRIEVLEISGPGTVVRK